MKALWAVGLIVVAVGLLVLDRRADAGGTNWKRVVVAREVVVEPGETFLTDPIDVRGWRNVTWKVTFSEGTDEGATVTATVLARNFPNEPFDRAGQEIATHYDPGVAIPYHGIATQVVVVGAENQIHLAEHLADHRMIVSISAILTR